MKNPRLGAVTAGLALMFGLAACTNPYDPGQRAVGGGLIGAGTGAAIGAAAGGGRGAAIGAAVGGATGAVVGATTTPPPPAYPSTGISATTALSAAGLCSPSPAIRLQPQLSGVRAASRLPRCDAALAFAGRSKRAATASRVDVSVTGAA